MNAQPDEQEAKRAGNSRAVRRSTWKSGRGAWWIAVALGLAAAGCSVLPKPTPDLTRFYVLTSPTPKAEVTPTAEAPKRVMLRPVVVPEFLRGRMMPVRVGNNELRFNDQERWAESLEPGLSRVLRDGLAQQPGVRLVLSGADAHDFDVAIQIRHCEGVLPAGVARLAAQVEIFSAEIDPKPVAREDFSLDVPGWDGKDYGELAQKLSEAAESLAARIAMLLPPKNK